MDMAQFDGQADRGAWMTIMHPATGAPLDGRIRLAGIDSARYRTALATARVDAFKRPAASVAMEMQQAMPRILAAATLQWDNVQRNGADVPCTQANAEEIYEHHPWLMEQVQRFVDDRAQFFRAEGARDGSDTGRGDPTENHPSAATGGVE